MTRAEFTENLLVSLDTLRSHKVRTGLTLLGMVIGVTSVISVAAIIDGLNRFIQTKVEEIGSRTFFLARFPPGTNPFQLPEKIRTRRYLSYGDATRIRESARTISAATTMATRASFFGQSNEIRYGGERVEKVFVRGAEPYYTTAIPMFSIEFGRFFNQGDEDRAAQVVVLGSSVANSLFPTVDPLGKTVLLNGAAYEVIGVFTPAKGLFGGPGPDDFVLVPLSSFRKQNPDVKEVFIACTVPADIPMETAMEEVTEIMRRVRHIPANKEDDFSIFSSDFLTTLWNQVTGAIVILTGVISSIGLLVGGIGVMNIMLISVTERTKEIGVRKAIGARAADIRVQFLLEAITMTVVGGILGILGGAFIAWIVRTVAPSIPATISLFWVLMGVAMSAAVGVFFGYYPADRAARLDPIVCLRYE